MDHSHGPLRVVHFSRHKWPTLKRPWPQVLTTLTQWEPRARAFVEKQPYRSCDLESKVRVRWQNCTGHVLYLYKLYWSHYICIYIVLDTFYMYINCTGHVLYVYKFAMSRARAFVEKQPYRSCDLESKVAS